MTASFRVLLCALLALTLAACGETKAPADTAAAPYPEVKQPRDPELADGKVLVEQFLWLRCVHCWHAEEMVNDWARDGFADNVVFRRVPVVWSPAHAEDARYIALANLLLDNRTLDLVGYGKLLEQLFEITFVKQQPLNEQTAYEVFRAAGLYDDPALFVGELSSMLVISRVAEAERLTHQYGINSVPNFVTDGRYLINFNALPEGAAPPALLELINGYATAPQR